MCSSYYCCVTNSPILSGKIPLDVIVDFLQQECKWRKFISVTQVYVASGKRPLD